MKKKLMIIAEIGVNHNGSLKLAKKLVDKAKWAGADYIKIQNYIPELIVTKKTPKADYQKKNDGIQGNMYKMLKKYHFNFSKTTKLINYCKKKKINFMSSPFDEKSLKFLISKKIGIIKIASGEITNYPLLKELANSNCKIILSTGMANLQEVKNAINFLKKNGLRKDKIIILHCTSQYPTKPKDVNLNAMLELKRALNLEVGLSDHTLGFEAAICARYLGAVVVEKHITIDNKMSGPDHISSMEPRDFKKFVQSLRNTDLISGFKTKQPTKEERKLSKIVRKRIVAKKIINKGEQFSFNNITVKRTDKGLSANNYFKILNRFSKKKYLVDESI